MEEFTTWLEEELKKRDWQPADLAKKAKLGNSTVTRVLNGTRNAGPELCVAIAGALGEPPEKVFRIAGLLPPAPSPGHNEDLLLTTYRQMSRQQQEFLLSMLRAVQGHMLPPRESPALPDIAAGWPDEPAPDLEDIAEITQQLDELERRLLFDYARWRLIEQERRRDSSGKRKRDKAADQETINQIELYELIGEMTPTEREDLINYLTEMYFEQQNSQQKTADNVTLPA